MEKLQINILKECDEVADETVYHDPCPALYSPNRRDEAVRCVTWIVKLCENGDEYVIAPYFTVIAKHKMHCMNYLIWRADNEATKILKVVVSNFLVEIPFEVQIPENQKFMDVVVFAIPNITLKDPSKQIDDNNLNIEGVKLILYALERRV